MQNKVSHTFESALKHGTSQLLEAEIPNPSLDAAVLLEYVTNYSKVELIIHSKSEMSAALFKLYDDLIIRRTSHEPVAYITGEKEFWSLKLKTHPNVLIPRPDTETLVAAVVALFTDKNIAFQFVDVGCGTGAIALSILKEFPNAKCIAVDINPDARALTLENAKSHGLDNRLTIIDKPWLDGITDPVDMILSNPPYITTAEMAELMADVKDYEPHLALEAGDDGLEAYKALVPELKIKLKCGGLVLFEIGMKQAADVVCLLNKEGMADAHVLKDLAGMDRVVAAVKPEQE
jgi:release factor glutamine methyltransferase